MVIDIHKTIISNPVSRNLLKPWGSFAKPNSLRGKLFNKYTDPGNPIEKQVDFHPLTGQIYKVHDPPLSNNDRCSMFHDIDYTVAENVGQNPKDVKNRKLEADDKWLDCFKVRTPYDALAYTAIKSKRKLGLGNNFTMENLSQELNKPSINKFARQKIIINHINEIHSTDLVDMTQYSKMNKGYKYIFTNIDVFSKIAYAFPLKSKKIQDIKPCFEKIFENNKPEYIWSDKETSFLSKEMQQFFKDNNVKIYHTNSHLKAVVIERFNRSLRELMMKEFVKNNNTVWYNILPNLIKIYNNRYHSTIKMKPIQVNKSNEKYIKENIYSYNKTSKIPKFKINDLVRISLKRRPIFDKPSGNIKWSEELFKIHSINKSNVITYKIKDLNDEIIKGNFYEKELQKTKNNSEIYIIEKIIRKNKDKYLVKWKGYSNDFNSYVDKNDIIKYT